MINFDLTNVPETYVHRIGRTGRAENSGIAISFCDAEERTYLEDIERLIDKKISVVNNHPYHEDVEAVKPKPQGRSFNPRQKQNRPRTTAPNRTRSGNRQRQPQFSHP